MLAGMLSVLLVAGVIGLGVLVATDDPAPPDVVATTAAPPAGTAETATPAPTLEDLPAVKIRTLGRGPGRGLHAREPARRGRRARAARVHDADYRSNPPTSGTHFPTWYEDGVYAPGTTPELGKLVHALEHGRIELQYRPGTPAATVARLEKLVDELDSGYHMLLFENDTKMPFAVAATAWGHLLGCPEMNEKVFDALRAFRKNYVDKGPEIVP